MFNLTNKSRQSRASVADFLVKINNKVIRYVVAVALLVVSIPTVIGNIIEFYGPGKTPLAEVDNNELSALSYLKNNSGPNSIILTYPFDAGSHWAYKAQPWPISVWFDTAYVSAISGRRTFLSNEGQVDIIGIDYKSRHDDVQKYFTGDDEIFDKNFVIDNKIDYIYIYKPLLTKPLDEKTLDVTKIYENSEAEIFKVIK